jgi:DNA-binding GntR family transcriptional regulator
MTRPAPWWTVPAPLSGAHQYLSLRDHIARQIENGVVPAGAKLPSERQLQMGAGIARGTIRQALFQLEAEGVIYRRDRAGWYISPKPIVYDPTRWAGFMTYVSEQGRKPETQTLSAEATRSGALGAQVGAGVDDEVYVIRRRRLIDGRPVLVERIVVPPLLAPGLLSFSLDGSLTAILKAHYGVLVHRNVVDMQPCALVKEEAEALGVKSGTPGLLVVRKSFDAQGRVVEFDHEHWRHDAVQIHVETAFG